ncbi:hypothetical protein SALBM311S_03964 [Streptomyces alboniger]
MAERTNDQALRGDGVKVVRSPVGPYELVRLDAGAVQVTAVPALGGRLLSLTLHGREFLYRNSRLLDDGLRPHPGVRPVPHDGPMSAWLNWGGDKTWPAPQGWDGPDQWAGPPDPVLDSGPYELRLTVEGRTAQAVMTSGVEPRTGLRIERRVEVTAGRTAFTLLNTLTNESNRPTWYRLMPVERELQRQGGDAPMTNVRLLIVGALRSREGHLPDDVRAVFLGRQRRSAEFLDPTWIDGLINDYIDRPVRDLAARLVDDMLAQSRRVALAKLRTDPATGGLKIFSDCIFATSGTSRRVTKETPTSAHASPNWEPLQSSWGSSPFRTTVTPSQRAADGSWRRTGERGTAHPVRLPRHAVARMVRTHRSASTHEVLFVGFTVDLPFLEKVAIPVARGLGARTAVIGDAAQGLHDPVDVRMARPQLSARPGHLSWRFPPQGRASGRRARLPTGSGLGEPPHCPVGVPTTNCGPWWKPRTTTPTRYWPTSPTGWTNCPLP